MSRAPRLLLSPPTPKAASRLNFMDRLWSPWRYRYVSTTSPDNPCIFCAKLAEHKDEENFIVLRAEHNFVLLNLYPYTSGHLMVAPYAHVPSLAQTLPEARAEMIELTARAEKALRVLYKPDGINLGMNLGEAAGAGVAGHIHMHVLPRWVGDAGFMSTVSETRILPEELPVTYQRLKAEFAKP
jgi:ATP adenylyltransferase